MHNNILSRLPKLWQRSCKLILPVAWIIGLVIGMWLAAGAGDSFSLTMRGAFSSVSISGLLLVTALPFLLTALAVILSQPLMLLVVVLSKASSFGFCAYKIATAYGSVSWLVRFLLMFADVGSLPLLMWLWLRHGDMAPRPFMGNLAGCLAAAIALGLLDISVVSPFAALLL